MNDKITLLITTYNRGRVLANTLERLTHLTVPDEVLIVDDGSNSQTDATQMVCKGFKDRLPIRYIYNHNPGVSICSFARNIGVKQALGDTIITSEPELLWGTDIIAQMKKKQQEYPRHVISVGTIYHMQDKTTINDTLISDPQEFFKHKVVEDYRIEPRPYDPEGFVKTVDMTATFCALYERPWLEQIGGWDEQFPGNYGFDDHDLLTRLRIAGYNQIIESSMEAVHQWHEHQPPHIQGPQVAINDKYFTGKNMHTLDNPFIVANKGKEWGVLQTRAVS